MIVFYIIPPQWKDEDFTAKSVVTVRDFLCFLFGFTLLKPNDIPKKHLEYLTKFLYLVDDGLKSYSGAPGQIVYYKERARLHEKTVADHNAIFKLHSFICEGVETKQLNKLVCPVQERFLERAHSIELGRAGALRPEIRNYLVNGCAFLMNRFEKKSLFQWFCGEPFKWLKNQDTTITQERFQEIERIIQAVLSAHETEPEAQEEGKEAAKSEQVTEPAVEQSPASDNFFPAPKGTKWKDITIILLSNDTVEISIKDSDSKKRFSYHQLEMADKRQGDRPKLVWWTLVLFCKERGHILPNSENYDPTLTDRIKTFKKHMKNLFGIDEEVIGHYKSKGGYKTNFNCKDRTQVDYKTLLKSFSP